MEQLNLFETTPTEKWVYNILKESLIHVITQNNVDQNKLVCKKGKSYSSVWYGTQMAFRIYCRDGRHYFSVSNAYAGCETPEILKNITEEGHCDGFTNYNFEPTHSGIEAFSTLLASVLDMTIDSLPKEFDCCSRFDECSNAKRCTNPNTTLATGCGYRKIMKSGRIYYGKNRNI